MDRKPSTLTPVLFLAVFMCLVFTGITAGQNRPEPYVKDELLVKFSHSLPANVVAAAHRRVGASVLQTLGGDTGWHRVKLPNGIGRGEAIRRYSQMNGVEAVQPNFYYYLQATPNDPQFTSSGMYGLTKIAAPAAWDLYTGNASVVVADIDTGTRFAHQDLAANLWKNPGEIAGNGVDDDANGFVDDVDGWDFFFDRANASDEHGHGTHTAGTIGAVGNNGLGVVGVNWTVKIMTIKIYDSDGFGTTSAMLVNAYNYVRMMKERGVNIRVTNNSYGGCDEACGYDQATKDAIDAVGAVDILQVFAAGNQGVNNDQIPHYPSSYTSPSILAVAASTSTDTRAGFSNFGVTSVDLAAPGSGILSTTFSSNASYGIMSGTSMATPHGAGAAALLAAYNPQLSAASIKATLMNTVDLLENWNGVVRTGGRLNVDNALRNQTVCTVNIPASSITVPTKGGVFSVNATTGRNCDHQVRTSANWLSLISSDVLSGNGTVTFRVTVNPTVTRTGTITIGGQAITVRQSRVL